MATVSYAERLKLSLAADAHSDTPNAGERHAGLINQGAKRTDQGNDAVQVPVRTKLPPKVALKDFDGERKLVVDTGGFIRLKRLEGELMITEGVAREIRCKQSRRHLKTLPDIPKIISGTSEDFGYVRAFCSMTGDLPFLSETDVEVIAASVRLFREFVGAEYLQDRPFQKRGMVLPESFSWAPEKSGGRGRTRESQSRQPEVPQTPVLNPEATTRVDPADTAIVTTINESGGDSPIDSGCIHTVSAEGLRELGGELRKSVSSDKRSSAAEESSLSSVAMVASRDTRCHVEGKVDESDWSESEEFDDNGSTNFHDCSSPGSETAAKTRFLGDDNIVTVEVDEGRWSDTEDPSDGGWVTEDNFHSFGVCGVVPAAADPAAEPPRVACVTTDYTIQNVLLQMGVPVLTLDGMVVRSLKRWGMLCRGCYSFVRDTSRRFCPACGNLTLQRVPIAVEDGKICICNDGRRVRLRGTVYPMPLPKGGRKPTDPVFAEDELMMCGRQYILKRQAKQDKARGLAMADDNAWWAAGWERDKSTGPRVQIGVRGNPNSSRNHTKNQKKK